MDPASGDILWQYSWAGGSSGGTMPILRGETMWLGEPREADNTAVVKAGDILFLLNDDAELIVARTDRNGFAPIHRYTVSDSSTWAQPAIVGNRIFIEDTNTLAMWTLD